MQLLAAFKDIFATGRKEITSENVVAELHKDPTSIWAESLGDRTAVFVANARPAAHHVAIRRRNSSTFSRGFYLPIRTSAHGWTRRSEKRPRRTEERRSRATECADVRIEGPLHGAAGNYENGVLGHAHARLSHTLRRLL